MAWLSLWRSLLEKGFSEAVNASCQFGSIHQKEFRVLVHLLNAERLTKKCPGGHFHVPIQGAYTKPSATYVPDLALHIAQEFQRALLYLARLDDDPPVLRHESLVGNVVMLSSRWDLVEVQHWKKPGHRNILEI